MNDVCPVCWLRFTIDGIYQHIDHCGLSLNPLHRVTICLCGWKAVTKLDFGSWDKQTFHHYCTAHTPEQWRKLMVLSTLESMP